MSQIQSEKYSIEKAFTKFCYVVPQYQREYVWGEKQINILLEDIKSSFELDREGEYFIGTTIVSNKDKSSGNLYDIIDGQQRLTTLFLIICALTSILPKEGYSNINNLLLTKVSDTKTGKDVNTSKLELNYDGTNDFIKYITENSPKPEDIENYLSKLSKKEKTNSIQRLSEGYKLIYTFFSNTYKTEEEIGMFWAYLSHKVSFIQIQADIGSALKIFETINERGVGLNPMDLLKNLIFINTPPENFKDINKNWKEITNPLENAKEKPLRFLRYYIMANYPITDKYSKDGVIREEQIYDWFKDNNALCHYKENPDDFIKNIKSNVDKYINFIEGKDKDGQENRYLHEFQSFCGGGFSLHFIVLLSAIDLPENLFNHLVKQLETVILYYIITKTSTKELEIKFAKWATKIKKITSIKDLNTQTDEFNKFIREEFFPIVEDKKEEYKNYFNICALNSLQKYRIKYILSKIAQYIDNFIIGLSNQPHNIDSYLKLEIEHILPNTEKEEVANDFYKNAKFPETKENKEYQKYKLKLGNLTLLEKPLNIVAGCDILEFKKEPYLNSNTYLTSSIIKFKNIGSSNSSVDKINNKLKSYYPLSWNDKNINDRQQKLYELSKDIWKVEEYIKK